MNFMQIRHVILELLRMFYFKNICDITDSGSEIWKWRLMEVTASNLWFTEKSFGFGDLKPLS